MMIMSNHVEGQTFQLPLVQFFAAINKERRAKLLVPVEPAVISVRTSVKFAIVRRRPIKLQTNRVALNEDDLEALEQILAELFNVRIEGSLSSLCEGATAPTTTGQTNGATVSSHEPGVISRLFGRLMGQREHQRPYTLKTNSLILGIINRRAYMGNKFMHPQAIRKKCAEALHKELGIETDMRGAVLALHRAQLDAVAEIIRREFQIMFDNLDDLLGETVTIESTRVTKATRYDS
jgi:hypothetical protein